MKEHYARIYGVKTKVLNQAVNRDVHRFPEDFMFQLIPREFHSLGERFDTSSLAAEKTDRSKARTSLTGDSNLRSQSVTSSRHGGRRYLPFAFTEHGAIMAANVLNSERSVAMCIYVIRAFKYQARNLVSLTPQLSGPHG
ncbi:MAG: ORF6N domain-containing protein [Terriglobia bacterium]